MTRLRTVIERFRGNLFFVPALFLTAAIALAEGAITLDVTLHRAAFQLPVGLASTVASARSLLGTVASATIAFAGIAFSVSLLMVQLASTQYSPRVIYGFLRDPFGKRVMGLVIGTFTFCLLVLLVVHAPAGSGVPVVPQVSVLIAVVLGVSSIVAVVALISHGVISMQAGEIVRRITDEAREQIERECAPVAAPPRRLDRVVPDGPGLIVRAPGDGWVQTVDIDRLLGAVPEGGVVRLETWPGAFVPEETPICTVWPMPEDVRATARTMERAFVIGRSRTMQQDLTFGIRQLVDIALRALSPGVNDPTTANSAIVHIGAVLRSLLLHDLPSLVLTDGGRRVIRPREFEHRDYVALGFDEIRRAGAGQPAVAESLLQVLGMLAAALGTAGLRERIEPLRAQARLVVEVAERSDLPNADLDRIHRAGVRAGLSYR
ncbi:MAG TPA: DUF2254 domain-containing protein [Actinomycetota bacterium]|jgi:uncharacterized membrane protein|nr:DUF2254 domain-containing protein [Actinomycetota bacterium]